MALAAAAGPARAAVHLRLAPAVDPAQVGQIVNVALLASNDQPADQEVSSVEAILHWDPDVLRLLGVTDPMPSPWFVSGFLADPDGINNSLEDGDALYTALASPSQPATIPGNGEIVVTELRFEVLAASPETHIDIVAEQGEFGETRVFAPSPPQTNVLGSFEGASLTTIACASGDADSDGDVDLADVAAFQACFGSADALCRCLFDFDSDQDLDLADWEALAGLLSGPAD